MGTRLPVAQSSAGLTVARTSSGQPTTSASMRCRLFGHSVHYTRIPGDAGASCTRCGEAILGPGNTVSHVAHTLSCFFGRHRYVHVARRNAHREYVCERCGHPLLLREGNDPFAVAGEFEKRVDYVCGLMGHRVHTVTTRSNATEYACVCGHSFVTAERGVTFIRHRLACMLFGHLIQVNEIRSEWAEYVCHRCGHPFCFMLSERPIRLETLHG